MSALEVVVVSVALSVVLVPLAGLALLLLVEWVQP